MRPAVRRAPGLAIVASLGCIALGLTGMVGVAFRSRGLVELVPGTTPIRFNTALCFAVAGAGLLAAARGRRTVAWVGAGVLATVAGLSALEYALGVDLHIDELLVSDYRLTPDQLPRMAPNTAAGFLVAALALGLAAAGPRRRWMPATVGLSAVFVASIGSVSLVGYVVGQSSAYRWGDTQPIAVVTSFGLVLLAAGLVQLASRGSARLEEGTPRWLSSAIGIAVVVVNVAVVESISNMQVRSGGTIQELGGAREVLLAVAVASAGLLSLATHFALAARRQTIRVRHEEAFNRRLLDAMDDLHGGVAVLSGTAIEFVNEGFCRISGYRRDELLALPSMMGLVVPERRQELALIWERLREEPENVHSCETTILAIDGSRVEVEIATKVMPDEPSALILLARDITEQKRSEALLRQSERRLIGAQEEERRRIAADIHDDPVQKMAAVSIRLDVLRRRVSDPAAKESLDSLGEVVRLAIARLRQLLFELRPPAVERGGLADTIRRFGEEMERVGVVLHVEDHLGAEPPGDVSVNAYRIAQEALSNIRKHARASRASVTLEMRGGSLAVRVEDDGIGITPERLADPVLGHIGIDAMRERAQLAGGSCTIESAPGGGTSVACLLPVDTAVRNTVPA